MLEIVTPMFGGGTRAREIDQTAPIRATAISGQLRFWWRALFGSRYADGDSLFVAEEAIFGSDRRQGQIALHTRLVEPGDLIDEHHPAWRAAPAYALFPFRSSPRRGVAGAVASLFGRFEVEVRPGGAPVDDIVAAIRLWVAFGGIGARGRRGCGSLAFVEQGNLPRLAWPEERPRRIDLLTALPATIQVSAPDHSATRAWRSAVELYSRFRQGAGFARREPRPGDRIPGRSFYPEPDTIRRLRGQHAAHSQPRHPVDGFPRADLGLPIVFEFKNAARSPGAEGEPTKQLLRGAGVGRQRFASPVITKAVADGAAFRPMIMVLGSPPVWSMPVELVQEAGQSIPIPVDQLALDASQLGRVQPLGGHPARTALQRHARGRGYEELRLCRTVL